jgi:hypothetical protein
MKATLALYLLALVCLASCAKPDSKDAVRKAVEAYLAQRKDISLGGMDLEIGEVKFQGETATAEVKFRSKQPSGMAVTVHYNLRRHGGQWNVESAASSGGSPHGRVSPSSPHGETKPESSH